MINKKKDRGISAWLITWEKIGSHVKKPRKVAAILNPRIGHERIKEIVELLYVNEIFTLSESISYAQNRKYNPYPAEFGYTKGIRWTGRITCGHNPFLEATLVKNLLVTKKGIKEDISWVEKEPRVSTQVQTEAERPLLSR